MGDEGSSGQRNGQGGLGKFLSSLCSCFKSHAEDNYSRPSGQDLHLREAPRPIESREKQQAVPQEPTETPKTVALFSPKRATSEDDVTDPKVASKLSMFTRTPDEIHSANLVRLSPNSSSTSSSATSLPHEVAPISHSSDSSPRAAGSAQITGGSMAHHGQLLHDIAAEPTPADDASTSAAVVIAEDGEAGDEEIGGAGGLWLLPPIAQADLGRKCLVLDLDETLVHSSFKIIHQADYIVPVEIEAQYHNVYVIKRPGVDSFLKSVGDMYEVVVFTASLSKYADPVLDKLDVHRAVKHRLFRESCFNHGGNYVKVFASVGWKLTDTGRI